MRSSMLHSICALAAVVTFGACGATPGNTFAGISGDDSSRQERRGGGNDDSGDDANDDNGNDTGAARLVRGSQSWFVKEALEETLMLLNDANAMGGSVQVSGASAAVVVSLANGQQRQAQCQMIDTTSRGGTVQKKDVVCTLNN